MYGNGFFYIPGTETCLNINGYVRVDYTHNIDGGFNADEDEDDSNAFEYRARLNFDARNETDFGTLRSQLRIQGTTAEGQNANAAIDRALISLAGFRLGFSDSYTTTVHGYGLPVEKYDGFYGFDQAIFFDYTYAANGFSATIGVQDSITNSAGSTTSDFDYYVGASYSGSWGSVAGSYIYEEEAQEGAWKVSATITAIDNLTVKGFYVGDEDGGTRQVQGSGDYAWGIGANYNITDTFAIRAGYSAVDEPDIDPATGLPSGTDDFFVVGAQWNPVPGLSIRPEAAFGDEGESYAVRVYRTF
jgi:hypothetical protein